MKTSLIIFLLAIFCEAKGQIITTIAGVGSNVFSGDGGPATAAGVPNPAQGDFDKWGNYYFADAASNRVRKINTLGIISTIAGNGMGGYAGDNASATLARLNGPVDVKLDASNNIFIADLQNNRVRKIDASSGIITTIAGTGIAGYFGEGVSATTAKLWAPEAICLDKSGNLFIADAFNYRIRKVTPSGIISTFAGNGTGGYSGEGTRADTSKIGFIPGICADTAGNIFIADNSNGRVFKINSLGIMTTIAGNGTITYSGDGIPATAAQINPVDVAFDSSNNLFIADKGNNRIYKVDAFTNILNNVAGNGLAGDSGDNGPATAASLFNPIGVALDPCNNLFIPTIGTTTAGTGRRVRKVTFYPTCNLPRLDMANVDSERSIYIYPNPSTTKITIVSEFKIAEVVIYNLSGQMVSYFSYHSVDHAQVTTSDYPAGIYFLRITDDVGIKMLKKFIKR
jgi:trimeric autotransporter adhesin